MEDKSPSVEPVVVEISSVELQRVWSRHSATGRISFYRQFVQHCLRALLNLKNSMGLTIISLFTAFLALLLLTALAILFRNINNYLEIIGSQQSVSIFLRAEVADEELSAMQKNLQARSDLAEVQYISSAKALEQFRLALAENAAMLDGLEGSNPLPASFEVKLKSNLLDGNGADRFVAEMRKNPGVEHVRYSRGLLKDFGQFFRFLRFAGGVAVALMLLVTAVIVSNTISLAIFSYRDEIRIMRLLGARASFIRAPFLLAGSILGLAAGCLAVFFAKVGFSFLSSSWPQVLSASQIFPAPVFVEGAVLLGIVCIGIFVGCLGAWIGSRVYSQL
jgi:cell division transport system permease protein